MVRLPRNVWILSGIALGVAIGFGVVNPVLPVFAVSFGVNELAAAAVVSAFALMRLVFAPAVGFLTDRWGHRLILLSGVLIVAVSSLATGFARSYGEMIVFRGLGGLGSAMFSVSAMTILLSSVSPSLRGRASAVYQGSFLVGAVAGPALGGLLGNISMRTPFFFYSITLGLAAVVALGLEPITGDGSGAGARVSGRRHPRSRAGTAAGAGDGAGEDWPDGEEARSGQAVRPLSQVLRDRRYQAALLAHLAQGWNTSGTRAALIPLFVATYLASSPGEAVLGTGIIMSVGAVVQMLAIWPSGVVVDRVGRRGPMMIGALIAAAAMAVLPFSRSFAVLAGLLAVYAIGAALIGTAPSAAVGDAAGRGGTRAIALYSMAGDTGSVVGPLVAGYLAAEFSYVTACAAGAVLWVASALMSSLMPRSRPA
jgi:MFS family permease